MALAASYIIINISEIIMAKRTYEELVQLRQDGRLAGSSSYWKAMMQRVTGSGVRIMAWSRLMTMRSCMWR